jgi:hypothetical protein
LNLLGVRVATGLAAQLFAFLGKRLLDNDAAALGRAGDLVARDLQQAAVHWVRNGLLLHRGVDDHALELGLLDEFHRHGRFERGLE